MQQIGAATIGRGLVPRRAIAPTAILPALGGWLGAGIAQDYEQRRLFPWLAVAFGGGILLFFTMADGMPALAAPLVLAGLAAAITPFLGARPVALALVLGVVAAALGFAAATYRVSRVAAPVLQRTSIAVLTGFVEALDERDEGARLVIRVASFGTLKPDALPARVRVSYKTASANLKPGLFIASTARLLPPPEAARPGGYDFARDAYFRRIGAVGSLVGKIEVKPPPQPVPLELRVAAAIDEARNAVTRRIADANGGQAGAVAAALVTGKRGLITPETNEILRAAGIYHVVSISGLHMVLAAGVVFWLVRGLLALVPHLALLWPIKKIAAGFAMLGVLAYCAFSGWDLAAERALIMTLIMLGAILVDRPALSMRNLALAAIVTLAREPEGLLGPSFQMSFAAVAGLIACARLIDGGYLRREGAGRFGRLLALSVSALIGTLATTLVAQFATAPFATYHFQTIQPFGLIGNALTLPLVSLAVMPAAVLGILAYPFALDQPVWWLMGMAVRGILAISGWVADFGQATLVIPAFGVGALGLMAAALLLATLPSFRLRWLALPPALVGLGLATQPYRFDIYVDRQGSGAMVRMQDGRLAPLGRPSGFVMEQWLKADGDVRRPADVASAATCDTVGCTTQLGDGRSIAFVKDRRAFAEDCRRAAIVISALTAPASCTAGLVIDRAYLADHGATAIRAAGAQYEAVHAERSAWRRPISPAPPLPIAPNKGPAPPDSAGRPSDEAETPGDGFSESLQ